MPIREENRARYPRDWKRISREAREAAGNRCEGSPAFPDCRAENGKPHPETGSRVVLTVAHLDHQPENCERENLRAWCQRCHNVYDAPMRRRGIRERFRAGLVVAPLLLAALVAFPASAQNVACGPYIVVAAYLERQHGESVVATGLTSGAVLHVFVNPDTRTWTILSVTPDGLACGLASGEAMEFAAPVKKGERS